MPLAFLLLATLVLRSDSNATDTRHAGGARYASSWVTDAAIRVDDRPPAPAGDQGEVPRRTARDPRRSKDSA